MNQRELFLQALDLTNESERAAFLERACAGRPELQRQLAELLQAHDQAGGFLAQAPQPAGAAARTETFASVERPAESVGTIIAGKYKLLQPIGEGGMGAVWMADQLEPVRRRVAVKLIRLDRDGSRTIILRFEAERQAIALMDHPNIAKLLDAGTIDGPGAGRPYFVMELVKGVPLTEFCDEHRLSVNDRLKLFMQICGAVQHAHQKGIIHRDLKPSNILVEMHDNRPVPKVIDFGLAKALSGQPLTEHTLFTAFGTVAGTPLYMAPEQAKLNAIDVDTRADIYALGVILYELLTGTTPIERATLKQAALDEILRVIRELEPPTPSQRLSTSESVPSVAANRQTEPARLGRVVRGELDWIVMKALAKERERRYETAAGLSQDVERFLQHEPVAAGPPALGYRLRKFVARHRIQVLAGALVVAALLVGLAGTTWGLLRAETRRKEAEQARASEAAQRTLAESERRKAEMAEAETLEDFRAATDDAIEQLIGSKATVGPKEQAYLERALQRWQTFADRHGDNPRSLGIRAEGQFRVARLYQKLGRAQQALDAFVAAIPLYEQLIASAAAKPIDRHNLAGAHYNVAVIRLGTGRADLAQREFETAGQIWQQLVAEFPADRGYRRGLASNHNGQAEAMRGLRQLEPARAAWEAARQLQEQLVEQTPDDSGYQQDLARTYNNLGVLLGGVDGLQRYAEALANFESAVSIQQQLVERFPQSPEHRLELARTWLNQAAVFDERGDLAEAKRVLLAATDLQRALVREFPAVPQFLHEFGYGLGNLAFVLTKHGQMKEASAVHDECVAIRRRLVDENPGQLTFQVDLAASYANYATHLQATGDTTQAAEYLRQSIARLQPLVRQTNSVPQARRWLFNSHLLRARLRDDLHQHDAAAADWEQAVELSPDDIRAQIRYERALSQSTAGKSREAVTEAEDLLASAQWSPNQTVDFARIFARASRDVAEKSDEYAERAVELLRAAVRSGFRDGERLAADQGFLPLHKRSDFRELLDELGVR